MDEPPCTAEAIASALTVTLLRKGVLDPDDIATAADSVEAEDENAAHVLRCAVIEAEAPTQSEWLAEQARKRFRVIEPD